MPSAPVPSAPDNRLLAGLRVIELSSFVASPLGGMTLAQLGADVIRIDPLGGAADYRRLPLAESGTSIYWAGLNKAKRSVTVDFRSPEGQRVVTDLVIAGEAGGGDGGGILLTNAVGRPWLGDDVLRARRADLIHLQILGRRDGGAAVDYTVNAAVGFPMVTGPAEHAGPVNHVAPAWDIACGLYAAIGILAAERRRARSGDGCFVSVALEDVAIAMAGNLGFLGEVQINGAGRQRTGNDVYGTFGRDFACAGGTRVMVVALTSRHWRALVELTGVGPAVGALEGALGVDFARDGDRWAYREALGGLMAPWFSFRSVGDAMAVLDAAGVLCERYRTFAEVVTDLSAGSGDNPLMTAIDQPGLGVHLAPGCPVAVDGLVAPATPAPVLGGHGGDVLAEVLGLSPGECGDLVARGVVGPGGGAL